APGAAGHRVVVRRAAGRVAGPSRRGRFQPALRVRRRGPAGGGGRLGAGGGAGVGSDRPGGHRGGRLGGGGVAGPPGRGGGQVRAPPGGRGVVVRRSGRVRRGRGA